MPQWKLSGGATYVVTGAPVLAGDLASTLAGSTLRLLVIAVIVMALVLVLLFRARLRLLPLAIALAACAIVFGGLVAARAAADHGLDRRRARVAGPGGRLRDPVPVRRARGGDRHRARCPPSPASSCCCCRRCRWCAGSARC
jgi:hypothetical protein